MPEQTMVQKFITAGLLALTVSTINASAAADTKGEYQPICSDV